MNFRKQTVLFAFIVVFSLFLAACGNPAEEQEQILATAQALAGTMAAQQLTEIAANNPSSTPTPKPPTSTSTASGPTNTPPPPEAGCLAARLSDESVPDDTVMQAGQPFEKGWVLTNTGTCTWTEEYALAFHHGEDMGGEQLIPLSGWVAPGESVTLSVDLFAPAKGGSHIGFWSIKSPEGVFFGPSANGTFWVRIVVPGPTPLSTERNLSWASGGGVREDGSTTSELIVGDNNGDLGYQGFVTFNYGNLSDESTVTGVVLDLSDGYKLNGDPFADLGCLNVYWYTYGTLDASDFDAATDFTPLWSFCSAADLKSGLRFGGQDAIKAIQDSLSAGQIQLALAFAYNSDVDKVADTISFDYPLLTIYWYK